MHRFIFPAFLFLSSYLIASEEGLQPSQDSLIPAAGAVEAPLKEAQPIEPFTGKITRNKVRMRLQPSLEAPILCELSRDDLLSVVGENDEFYAILPPKETRAYIFRTFVLDNVVEGSRVNVRLEPALEAPVIGQLNTGDRVEGAVSPLSSKWLEILPPEGTRFYVCKEYVEKIGSPAMLAQVEKRRMEVAALLNSALLYSENELQKEYRDINLGPATANLTTIIKQYTDFPKSVERAKEILSSIQETYLKKKIEHLEGIAYSSESTSKASSASKVADSMPLQPFEPQSPPEPLPLPVKPSSPNRTILPKDEMADEVLANRFSSSMIDWNLAFDPAAMTGKMAGWIPSEKGLFDAWSLRQPGGTPQEFYEQQLTEALTLRGILEPYSRTIRNKPGDYLLVSPATNLPIAYLYSTRVNLQDSLGQEVTLHAIKRPNNNFAFPAYYVISLD